MNLNLAAQGSSLKKKKHRKRTNKQADLSGNIQDEADCVVEVPPKDDMSVKAIRARMKYLSEGATNLSIIENLKNPEKERVDIFYDKVKSNLESGTINVEQLVNEAERLEIKVKAPFILAELLFDDKIHVQIKKYRNLLLHFTHDDTKAQKYLLGGIEQVVSLHKDTLLRKVSFILKLFYDNDILEESVLLDWHNKISKKYSTRELNQKIHNAAEPFIKWLRETEEKYSDQHNEYGLKIEYKDQMHTALSTSANKPKQKSVVCYGTTCSR